MIGAEEGVIRPLADMEVIHALDDARVLGLDDAEDRRPLKRSARRDGEVHIGAAAVGDGSMAVQLVHQYIGTLA